MKIDNLLKFFVPQDNSFFPLFESESRCILESANLLNDLIYTKTEEERQDIFNKIRALEDEADGYTHGVYEHLNKSFLTPFDREDIHALASHLDDVIDRIYAVSQRIQWYKPKVKKISEEFKNFVTVINQMAKEIETAVIHLRDAGKNKEKILQACMNLNTLENEADRIFYAYMSQLFENKAEDHLLEVMKNKDIFQTMEKCADAAEDVSDIIKTILIKNV
jgi:uncharacterized protein